MVAPQHTPHRKYRQSEKLYDLIGRMADHLETSRTTVVELAVYDLARQLEQDGKGKGGLRRALAEKAAAIDGEKTMAGLNLGLKRRAKRTKSKA